MPFAGYDDLDDCVGKNQDKDDPEAYCGSIKVKAEKSMKTKERVLKGLDRLAKQGPPGPPPRPGLKWNDQSHRWVREQEGLGDVPGTTQQAPESEDMPSDDDPAHGEGTQGTVKLDEGQVAEIKSWADDRIEDLIDAVGPEAFTRNSAEDIAQQLLYEVEGSEDFWAAMAHETGLDSSNLHTVIDAQVDEVEPHVKASIAEYQRSIADRGVDLMLKAIRGRRVMRGLSVLAKQGPPGPPPRPGLVWKPETSRWVHEQSGDEFEHSGDQVPYEDTDDGKRANKHGGASQAMEAVDYVEADGGMESLQEAVQMLLPHVEDRGARQDVIFALQNLGRDQFNLNAQEQMRMALDEVLNKGKPEHTRPILAAARGALVRLQKGTRGMAIFKGLAAILDK